MLKQIELSVEKKDSGYRGFYATYYTEDEEDKGEDVFFDFSIDSEGQVTCHDDVDSEIVNEARDLVVFGTRWSSCKKFDEKGELIK